MNLSDNVSKLVAGALCALVLLACAYAEHRWGAGTTLLGRIEDAAFGILVSLGVYHAATASAGRDSSSKKDGQAGRTLWFFPLLLALVAVAACMSGCTTTTAAVADGLTSSAVQGIKAWDDRAINDARLFLCGQPYSAIQRHPEIQPAVQALCGPLANASSLDANQLAMLMSLLRSSGVQLQAVPAR